MDGYKSFVAVIYVTDREEEAVMRMYDWTPFTIEGDSQLYYRYEHPVKGMIYCARQDEMGMTASATLTMKLIEHFRPAYVLMPGIAAGARFDDSDEQMYGDVLLASMVWNYSNGKYVPRDMAAIYFGEVGFLPRPTVVEFDSELISVFEKAARSENNETTVHIGPLASGAAVIANREIFEKQIKSQFKNTNGLEMEGYGVAYAASHATEPRPKAIIAKSICDFADSRKSDKFQKFAAYTSCEFSKLLIEEYL